MRLVICGQNRSGKSTLFKSLQKSKSVVEKKPEDIAFTTTISWSNPLTKEVVDVIVRFLVEVKISITDFNIEKALLTERTFFFSIVN